MPIPCAKHQVLPHTVEIHPQNVVIGRDLNADDQVKGQCSLPRSVARRQSPSLFARTLQTRPVNFLDNWSGTLGPRVGMRPVAPGPPKAQTLEDSQGRKAGP